MSVSDQPKPGLPVDDLCDLPAADAPVLDEALSDVVEVVTMLGDEIASPGEAIL